VNTFVFLFSGRESTKTEGEAFSGKVNTVARVIMAGKIIFVETGWGGGE